MRRDDFDCQGLVADFGMACGEKTIEACWPTLSGVSIYSNIIPCIYRNKETNVKTALNGQKTSDKRAKGRATTKQ